MMSSMDITLDFYGCLNLFDEITLVAADISTKDVQLIYDSINKLPQREDGTEDDLYIFGEIHFYFNKDEGNTIKGITLVPVYEDIANGIENKVCGKPIKVTNLLGKYASTAWEYYKSNKDGNKETIVF
jgi:hypothetical protein